MKQYIKLDQILYSDIELTETQMESFIDDFLTVVEKHNLSAGGMYGLYTEEEVLDD